jgi:hypothetical protein
MLENMESYSTQVIALITFLALLLQCLVGNRLHVLEYLYSVQASFFSLCQLG